MHDGTSCVTCPTGSGDPGYNKKDSPGAVLCRYLSIILVGPGLSSQWAFSDQEPGDLSGSAMDLHPDSQASAASARIAGRAVFTFVYWWIMRSPSLIGTCVQP